MYRVNVETQGEQTADFGENYLISEKKQCMYSYTLMSEKFLLDYFISPNVNPNNIYFINI